MLLLDVIDSEKGDALEIMKWDGRREPFDMNKLQRSLILDHLITSLSQDSYCDESY